MHTTFMSCVPGRARHPDCEGPVLNEGKGPVVKLVPDPWGDAAHDPG